MGILDLFVLKRYTTDDFRGNAVSRQYKREAVEYGNYKSTLRDLFISTKNTTNATNYPQTRAHLAYRALSEHVQKIINILPSALKKFIVPHTDKFINTTKKTFFKEYYRAMHDPAMTRNSGVFGPGRTPINVLRHENVANILSTIRKKAVIAGSKDALRGIAIGVGAYFAYQGAKKLVRHLLTNKKKKAPMTLVGRAEHNRRISQGLLASKKLKHKVR